MADRLHDEENALPERRLRPVPPRVVVSALLLGLVILAALGANRLTPFPIDQMHVADRLKGPSLTYLAGTDEYGRDVFSRTLYGSRLSLFLGFAATLIGLCLGVPLGLFAGYARGFSDELLMRALDVVMSFPSLLLVLLIIAVTPPSLAKTAIAIGILFVPPVARVSRSVALDLMSGEFILAAQARGERVSYILLRELLPNAWPAIVVEGSLRIAFAILLGAVLSFLGFGVQPPAADWGLMISTARDFVEAAPWMAIAPGLAMSLTVISINVLGDGLREYLDPKLGGRR
jgi:peptide/nickel transport system permease protein